MRLLKRRVVLAATATTLGIGGVLLPAASAMAATTPDHTATATAASHSATTAARTSSPRPADYYCEWDDQGNWVCYWW
jgi:hypothetical protein